MMDEREALPLGHRADDQAERDDARRHRQAEPQAVIEAGQRPAWKIFRIGGGHERRT
jgi:hypothetical protein